ncbi:hypothetical protein Tco_0316609 [Tanacetum coccineum]
MIPWTNDRKPLALPWGPTPRLDFDVRGSLVLGFSSILLVTVSGQSGTLIGQGSACNRGYRRRLPSASLLRKCLICIGKRDLAEREVKLLKMIEGHTILLDPPVTAALGDSGDSIDKLFDEGGDAGQDHSVERDDDVLEETIAKDVSEVAVEKTKKSKRKRKTAEDYLIPKGSSISSRIAEPRDDGLADFMSGLNLQTCSPSKRYVISSDDSYYSDSRFEVNFFAKSAVVDTPVMTIAVTITVVADVSVVQVSKDKVRSGNLETFRDSASASGANVNATSSSKLNEPTTSSDSFYVSQDLDSETLHNIYVPK